MAWIKNTSNASTPINLDIVSTYAAKGDLEIFFNVPGGPNKKWVFASSGVRNTALTNVNTVVNATAIVEA